MAQNGLHPQPIAGITVQGPIRAPEAHEQLLGYQLCEPQTCDCGALKTEAWIIIIICILFFWPAAFIPCLIPSCYHRVQRPVYGAVYTAQPVQPPQQGHRHSDMQYQYQQPVPSHDEFGKDKAEYAKADYSTGDCAKGDYAKDNDGVPMADLPPKPQRFSDKPPPTV